MRRWLLKPYEARHRAACVSIFDSNLPDYVADHERAEFTTFLDARHCPYFVVEDASGEVIACGGYGTQRDRARLCWGLVRRDHQRQGVGRWLLRSRLARIFDDCGPLTVSLDTSQKTCGFFERAGFRVVERLPDGYWPGLDKIEMELTLDQETFDRLRLQ